MNEDTDVDVPYQSLPTTRLSDTDVHAGTMVGVPILALFDQLTAKLDDQGRVSDQRLTAQDRLLRRIDTRLDAAATHADIERIEIHLNKHDEEILELRTQVHEDHVERSFRQRLTKNIGWFVAAIMVPLGAAIILVVATHGK